ncbi:MAG: hypothetical protein ACJA2W_002207 [Planctomycetota bacterium]
MQNPHHRPERGQPPLDAATASQSQLSLDGAALDLVRAATDEGDDALVRTLLRAAVALGLTSAATFWTPAAAGDASTMRWVQRRGFGGMTPEPDLAIGWTDHPGTSSPHPRGLARTSAVTFRFGDHGALVAAQESFDRDGERDRREEELETLVLLAETLLIGDGESSEVEGPGPDSHDAVAGPLPASDRNDPDSRQAD